MIRSVDDPSRPNPDAQYTPAIKQFSAPRTVSDDPYSTFGGGRGPIREGSRRGRLVDDDGADYRDYERTTSR